MRFGEFSPSSVTRFKIKALVNSSYLKTLHDSLDEHPFKFRLLINSNGYFKNVYVLMENTLRNSLLEDHY